MMALFITAALSGCATTPDEEDEGGDDTDTGTGTGPDTGPDGNETERSLTVSWVDDPQDTDDQGLQVTWRVALSEDGNTTTGGLIGGNDSAEIEETGVAYGFTSVAVPSSPDDYDNVTGQVNDTTVPDEFDATINATGDGALYLRAYARDNGTYYWSEEVQVNATASGGVEHEIVIQDGTVPVGAFAGFDTTELTIAVGDSVVWNNTASESHNIVITGPEEFETGSIASGERSDPIVFQTAGAYTFEFESGSSESGTITVEE